MFLAAGLQELRGEGADAADRPAVRSGVIIALADREVASGVIRTFDTLRHAVRACRRARDAVPRPNGMRPGHDAMLVRIGSARVDFQSMLRPLRVGGDASDDDAIDLAEDEGIVWPPIDHDMLLDLCRRWETGVDAVAIQRVIRPDGGVTTRRLARWNGDTAAALHASHDHAVRIGLER